MALMFCVLDGCLLIEQAGVHLKAPQVLMTTASVLFQRFFYVSSMRSFSMKVSVVYDSHTAQRQKF